MSKKKINAGKPYVGHASNQSDLTLQLCVQRDGVGAKEAATELNRRGKPILPPDLRQTAVEATGAEKPKAAASSVVSNKEPGASSVSSPVDRLIDRINAGGRGDQEMASTPKSDATIALNELFKELIRTSDYPEFYENNSLKKALKTLVDSIDHLWDYIGNTCGEAPDEKQFKSIKGRLTRIANNIRTIGGVATSLGLIGLFNTSELTEFLKPVYKYLYQKQIAVAEMNDIIESNARQEMYTL